jgi:hypothetical protein
VALPEGAVMTYRFEDPERPLSKKLINAFEAVATRTVALGPRVEAPLTELVHPVFATGRLPSPGSSIPRGLRPKRGARS